MDVRIGKRRAKKILQLENEHAYGNEQDDVQVRLQMYKKAPSETLGITEFEERALERLKILKAVERAGVTHIKGSEEYQKKVKDDLATINKHYTDYTRRDAYRETVRNDILSHYILRLAYCKTEDLRRWLIHTECDYFRFRYQFEFDGKGETLSRFLELNGLKFEPVSKKEKENIFQLLKAAAPVKSKDPAQTVTMDTEFFKVPFTDVLDLVRRRAVYIQNGFAYVSQNDLVSIIIGGFRAHLSQMLAKASRMIHTVDDDARLKPILTNLPKRHLGKRYDEKSGALDNLSAAMVPSLTKSFPPCMQNLYNSMREHHHLKHHGRQQYWNFLKGIGMPMEETIQHVREEFVKVMDPDKFDKEHRYNIRHSYGQEGKKTNYSPFSCMKIITANPPGPGDFHGCPFKHTDPSLLRQRLTTGQNRVSDSAAKTIVGFTKDNHFQVACSCYYEAVHDIELKTSAIAINHPNQYFKESQMRLHPERFEKKNMNQNGSQIKTEPRVKTEVKSEANNVERFEDMDDDFDA